MLSKFFTSSITSFSGKNAFLSNFSHSPIVYGGIEYRTVEHAYQAQKTMRVAERQEIARLATPGQAKRQGRLIKSRLDWDVVKVQVMGDLLDLKFTPGSELADMLLCTGEARLIEGNTWGDRFWGQCPLGIGKNMLGKLLISQRRFLQALEDFDLYPER